MRGQPTGLLARRALAGAVLMAAGSCSPVKAPGGGGGDGGVFDAAPIFDAGPPDGCPTDPCVANPFASTGGDGPFAPDADTVLPPGRYDFTTIAIPAGVTVTTEGNARLDLRATGAIVIDGVIDVSGANGGVGGPGPGAPTYTCYSGGGDGGATGDPLSIAVAGTRICAVGGDGGAGNNGGEGLHFDAPCPALQAGHSGGGGGGGVCDSGSGGGGFAGGGGGGGAWLGSDGVGGAGASFGGSNGGNGGAGAQDDSGTGLGGGFGGQAPGAYRGANGTAFPACADSAGGNAGGGSIGAVAAADRAVADTFYVGSGGGGGGGQCVECTSWPGDPTDIGTGSGGGGGGGGALRIASGTRIEIGATGLVAANGGAGGRGGSWPGSSGGGGGSGGVIYLSAPAIEVAAGGSVSALGGSGGLATDGASDCGRGGAGGIGRIRLSVSSDCSLEGTFDPPLAAGCTANDTAATTYIAEYPE